MGWKLDVGFIERNIKDGFPIKFSGQYPANSYNDTNGFILNLFGKEYKLLPTATANEYRAEVDTEFFRCILDTGNDKWTVYDTSGNIYFFGQSSSTRVDNTKPNWSGYSASFYWGLDQVDTASGDETKITYQGNFTSPYSGQLEKTIYPYQITYNGHGNVNGYSATTAGPNTITFGLETSPVPRPDYYFSYRWGFRTEQNRRLSTITCTASGQTVSKYQLSYMTSPATGRSLLQTVNTYGSDGTTALPPLTFTYQFNPNAVSFGPTIQWNNLILNTPGSSSGSYEPEVAQVNQSGTFNYTVADLIDIDGDGLPDRVNFDGSGSQDTYQVQKNLGLQANGNGLFGSRYSFGPTSTSTSTTPSDANPIPNGGNFSSLNNPYGRIRDIDGDGLPDRVIDYWKSIDSVLGGGPPYTDFTSYQVMLNTGNGFTGANTWQVTSGPLPTTDYNAPLYYCVESGGVNVGFFDIDGDGRPDRVMSGWYTQGPMTNFMVQFNTGTGFTSPKYFGPYYSQNWYGNGSQANPYIWAGIETPEAHMIDINGDGLPDRVMYPMDPSNPGHELAYPVYPASTYYAVEFNDGYSFEAVNTSSTVPGNYDKWQPVYAQPNDGANRSDAIENLPYVGMFDVNGDGLPDRVMVDWGDTDYQHTKWLVYLNNGHGFNSTPITVTGIENQGQWSRSLVPYWWSPQGFISGYGLVTTMVDINGDGLLDRVMAVYFSGTPTANYFLVQLNQGPYPDLMTNVNNGLGGNIGIAYKPSTAYDNRTDPTQPNSGSRMPFPRYVTSTVTAIDGVNPARTTTYGYAGGYFDGVHREFHGFAMVTNIDPTLRMTVTYFHTGGGRNNPNLGEYQDPGNFAKSGMAYRTETYGNDNLLYKVVVNQIDQVDLSYVNGSTTYARYFPFISQTFEYDYPNGSPNNPRITGSKFIYSASSGDPLGKIYELTQTVLLGEVANGNLNGYTGFNDLQSQDNQYHNVSYATIIGNGYILDHPSTVSLTSDSAGNNIVQKTTYTYNPSSGTIATKQRQICSGQNATTTYGSYNSYGLPTLITDPVGVVTEMSYDSTFTYPATARIRVNPNSDSANDLITSTTYDPRSGFLTQFVDPMGVTVNNIYNDPFFRLTASTQTPVGGSAITMKTASYNLGAISSGNAVSYNDVVINPGVSSGVETRTYLDGFGRPIETITQGEDTSVSDNKQYRVVSTAYDGRGNVFMTTWPQFVSSVAFERPPFGNPTLPASFIAYDAPGRVSQTYRRVDVTFDGNGAFYSDTVNSGDTGTSPLAAKQWAYVFNNGSGPDPWWIVCTDEDGKIRRYGLDAFGRTNQIQEVSGGSTYATTSLTHDLADNLTQINNQNGENIYYAYDQVGNLVAMADPYLGVWTYQRDAAGRVRIQTDGRNDVVTNSYTDPATGQQDPLGRVHTKAVFKSLADFNANNPYSIATYTYDVNNVDNSTYPVYKGLLYEVTDSEGTEKNGYDTRGRLIITTRHLNVKNQDYTTTYSYDDGDHVTSIGYPNSGPTINYSYWHGGSIDVVSRNGGGAYYTVNAGSYDQFGHVTQFVYGNNVTTTTRTYYPNSERLQSIATSPSVFSRSYQYTAGDDVTSINIGGVGTMSATYDDLHRIHSYSGLGSGNIYYGYDAVGSMTANIETGSSVPYGYGNLRKQAVKSAFTYTYLYDLCGNMTVRHGGPTTSQSQALEYDPENRLIAFSQPGVVTAEFGYAADGTRLWKRLNQDPNQVQVWIGNIYEEKGGKTLFHVFAGGQQVCTFEAASPLGGGSDSTAVGYYYHEDTLNTSSALSSSSGSQQEMSVYYPFGRTQTTSSQPGTFQVSRQFTGQVKDDETGLYYYNARYFDPELGRFVQADTEISDLSNPQSYNRYSYVLNNPLRYTDPTGHNIFSDWWSATKEGAGIIRGSVSGAVSSAAHHIFGGGQYPANNESKMLAEEGVQQFTPLTKNGDPNGETLGNPVTAVLKAGPGQAAMIMMPGGEEEKAGGFVMKEGEKAAARGVEDLKVLFHGTDSDSARNIVVNGIDKGAARNLGGGDVFWATEDKDIATLFAQANPKGGSPAVVAFKLPTSSYNSLLKSGAISVDKTGANVINDWDKFNKAVTSRSAQ